GVRCVFCARLASAGAVVVIWYEWFRARAMRLRRLFVCALRVDVFLVLPSPCFIHSPPRPSPRLVAKAWLRLARNSARLSHDPMCEAAIIVDALHLRLRLRAGLRHHGCVERRL